MDLVIRGGTIVDGSGNERFEGDVGVKDGRIVEVGGKIGKGKREIDASGAIVTPGFVDVHTHFDGQVTWDSKLEPASWHGVTSVVMGNCGVGFAPVRPDRHDWLIGVMEGVEDIPGSVLSEGIQWDWETFPEYLDALDRRKHALDVGTQIPHSAVRTYVMGERGVTHDGATGEDIEAMMAIVKDGLKAGALGFSTSRTLIHHYDGRKYPPGTFASSDELFGIGKAMRDAGHGVFQMTSNHVQMDYELTQWMTKFARETGRPVAFALVQTDDTPDLWKTLVRRLDEAREEGLPLIGSVSGRPAGILMSWQGSIHPFVYHPRWSELASLSWEERYRRLQDPALRRELIDGMQQAFDGPLQHDSRASYLTKSFHKMYALGENPDYEPQQNDSVKSIAEREGRAPLEVIYDMMMEQNGSAMIYFPSFNFANNDLSHLHTLLQHPNTMMSLADGGAHCGYICDVSMPTYLLTHWTRDRAKRFGPEGVLPLEHIVRRQTSDTARVYSLNDRGLIRPGYKADLNIIDYDNLKLLPPTVAFDLPANGKRLIQDAKGYLATIVSGEIVRENGQSTDATPGRLIRGPQQA